MFHSLKFIGRTQKNFLCVGAYDLEEIQQIGIINEVNIELSMDALVCLKYMPNVENLILAPGNVNPRDLTLLQGLPIKALDINYYSYEIDNWTIDLSQFPNLEFVSARTQYCFRSASQCENLHTLSVLQWIEDDLEYLSGSTLKALELSSGKLKSIKCINSLPHLKSLALENQRGLTDLSPVEEMCLESMAVISCNKVDTNIFPYLPHLRLLKLSGSRRILFVNNILRQTPSLEWLFLDHVVEHGNLDLLQKLQHAVIFRDCRHYSLKNMNLPKTSADFYSHYIPNHLRILP